MYLVAALVSQHGELLVGKGGVRFGQVKVLGLLDVKAHAHCVVSG